MFQFFKLYDTIVLVNGGTVLHKFLRSIGFSLINKKELEEIIEDAINKPEIMRISKDFDGNEFVELSKEFTNGLGLRIIGNFETSNSFRMDNYFPYYLGNQITTQQKIDIEKHYDRESYAGICDDANLGITLIFHLQNTADYLSENRKRNVQSKIYGAKLSGLSTEGKILLPIKQTVAKEKEYSRAKKRSELVTKAIDGNQEAIDNLAIEDMDMYALLSKRIEKEDILSIVLTTMIPYGIENDLYNIIAEIIDFSEIKNYLSQEEMYILNVKCNNLIFDVCINKSDLFGEPAIGRRFKGNLWMQGSICLD